MEFLSSPFPLQKVSEQQLQKLCRKLWNWNICDACGNGRACDAMQDCSWRRSRRLQKYFDFYKEVTASYVPELLPGSRPTLRGHDDILEIIGILKTEADAPRAQIMEQYFTLRDADPKDPFPPMADQNRAFNLIVTIMTMVTCSASSSASDIFEMGTMPATWRNDKSLNEFLTEAFPITTQLNHSVVDDLTRLWGILPSITAKRLQRVANLKFRPTNDLRNHLRLDGEEGTVEIFHHTAFLKEELMTTRPTAQTITGGIRREIALEVLDTIHKVLFPPDHESQALLRALVSKASFDPNCLHFESASYLSEEERNSNRYRYFGSRLEDLYDEVTNPRPRSWMEKWLERRSGARYVMLATLMGVFLAIILGVLGLAVGIFQAYVAWQQWKYPVT